MFCDVWWSSIAAASSGDGAAHPRGKSPKKEFYFDTVAMADGTVLLLEESVHELRSSLVCTSLHSSIGGYGDPEPFAPTLDTAPWLSSPTGGGDDELILMADLDVEQSHVDEVVLLCNDDPKHGIVCDDEELLTHHGIRRHVMQEAPRRVVRFPWGDVPTPWVSGYSTIYDTGIDDSGGGA